MTSLLIEDTFDTARMTAFSRALETRQRNACINDPYALRLAGQRGEEIVRKLGGRAFTWPIIVRTYIYDEIILRLAEQNELDTVINLAAGLDTRPYRLSLPNGLRWIEVDFPHVLSYKEEILADEQAVCRLERVPFDVTDEAARRAFLAQVGKESKQIFILAEGLLGYLTAAKVAAIAADLREQAAIHWWLTELVHPRVLAHDDKRWNTIAAEEAQTHFAPPGGLEFFQLLGWQLAEFRSLIGEGLRLKLPVPYGWLLRLLTRIVPEQPWESNYDAGGFILLKRAP